ncbi:GNAT family N-acetyltransferase [Gilvimarinus polysaccharolyticus]|uniref:GNAT family N-acetyltransferase n=1 Tax=Gilvimarinus polysaccharolyticus TaxID=863921 RepID=UPI0006737704|nr:GNAT family N-acetyltransferase [Gilvimarinus polysaccharolyticus]
MNHTPEFQCHTVSWATAAAALCDIRQQVFIAEQGVPPDLEWEHADEQAIHFLLTATGQSINAHQDTIGCARILQETHAGAAHFHIGRVAVVANSRLRGAGTCLMRELLHWCQQQTGYTHCEQVFLHAQSNVIPFYERLGFNTVGESFIDAGIEHRTMIWQTSPVCR